jgi:hypothetical protein
VDDAAPNLGDYLWMLKRQVRPILLAAVVGVVFAVLLTRVTSGRQDWASSMKVALIDDAETLGLGLGEAISSGIGIASTVEQVNSTAFRRRVLEKAGLDRSAGVGLLATGDDATRLVTLRISGPSREVVASAVTAAGVHLREVRRDQVLHRYASAIVTLTARRDLAGGRLATIDGLLAALPPESARHAALTHERVRVQEDMNKASADIAAFETYRFQGEGGVEVIEESLEPARSTGLSAKSAVPLGAVLGLLAGVGAVFVRRFLRLPVDSRAALERCGTRCVTLLGRTTGDRVAQAAIGQLRTTGPLAVLPGPGVGPAVLRRLTPDPDGSFFKVLDNVADVLSGAPVLLVLRTGIPEDNVRSLVLTAEAVGAEVIGAVLTDVPDRDLCQAFSR